MAGLLIQYAALPFKLVNAMPKILLVTTRETKRWILPKGHPEKDLSSYEVAAQEAYEEAGVTGRISPKTIGGFSSSKRLKSGIEKPTRVRVYLLEVDTELEDWPERSQRERSWMNLDEAIAISGEPGQTEFLEHFAKLWR